MTSLALVLGTVRVQSDLTYSNVQNVKTKVRFPLALENGKMGVFPVREMSGNFKNLPKSQGIWGQSGKVRENYIRKLKMYLTWKVQNSSFCVYILKN